MDAEANPLMETYGRYVRMIDRALEDELGSHAGSEFIGPLRYSLEGGKRIRPVILALAADCVGSVDGNALAAACAVELLHMESIIHDDIIDEETSRRGREPFHKRYGQTTSILTGDFVLGMILSISARLDSPRITADLATTAMLMSEGEMIEGRLGEEGDVTFDDYLRVIEYKTATAFEVAARTGAIIAGGTDAQAGALASYGKNVGIAYQIRDDLLDWKNEDRLFNALVRRGSDPRSVFDRMEEMLAEYSDRARSALLGAPANAARDGLEELTRLASFKG
ncbi:MAG: polyprenyl synthetase family protein [Nitrosopumilus sp.]|nr:polyprenyl synthetase family protein [Nitrosopumilus sp.]CAI9830969.1 Polyprenyl synthetase [Nitrosopumilaceae archaeon]MDA7942077.1 polyprenyl synthetase family protein [Nitrosopumilus sp.]MDA7943819.1 polyprenyl synthetase family protein [Nitrosopumilus sp.]MDA7945003.1 polyprenyl synthetase family protein [Nitrosopumilus sp.]